MPTIARIGPYRFFFYSSNGTEPIHVHVERDDHTAKFWLHPIRLHYSKGFSSAELLKIQKKIEEKVTEFERNWNEFFTY